MVGKRYINTLIFILHKLYSLIFSQVAFIKKEFALGVITTLLISTSPLVAMNNCDREEIPNSSHKSTLDFAHGVKKLNDYLYIGQKEPGLYFVVERIDDAVPGASSRRSFWEDCIAKEYQNHDLYRNEYFSKEDFYKNKKGFLKFFNPNHPLTGGFDTFKESLTYHSNNELYIVCAIRRAIEKADDLEIDDIEMAAPVMTDKGFPMITPMGVTRFFHYLRKAAKAEMDGEVPDKVHPNLAMDLFSFLAKVMEDKIYLIYSPMHHMKQIAYKTLPKDVYVGSTWTTAEEEHEKMKLSGYPFESTILQSKALEAGTENDWKAWRNQRNKEINEIAEKIEMPVTSPVRWTLNKVQIFDKEWKKVIFEHDKIANIIITNDQKLIGEDTARFNWFYHRDMGGAPGITMNLDAVSSYLSLMEWTN
jgi:hypothetical protein